MENELIKTIMEDIDFVNILTLDILDEGEQADVYKARKERERREQEKRDNKQASDRSMWLTNAIGNDPKRQEADQRAGEKYGTDDRISKLGDEAEEAIKNGDKDTATRKLRQIGHLASALDRHERRHPSN